MQTWVCHSHFTLFAKRSSCGHKDQSPDLLKHFVCEILFCRDVMVACLVISFALFISRH